MSSLLPAPDSVPRTISVCLPERRVRLPEATTMARRAEWAACLGLIMAAAGGGRGGAPGVPIGGGGGPPPPARGGGHRPPASPSPEPDGQYGNPSDLDDYIAELSSPARDSWQKPDQVVAALGLAKGQTA